MAPTAAGGPFVGRHIGDASSGHRAAVLLLTMSTNRRAKANSEAGYRPTLSVATHEAENAVEIRVRDNGTGIPADITDKLFQPFFTIEVASDEGAYTVFTIRLPRH